MKLEINLKKNQDISYYELTKLLEKLNYERVDMTIESGQYSIRGSIIDFFPESAAFPYRFEFFDDTIERCSEFNVVTQCSLRNLNDFSIQFTHKKVKEFKEVEKIHGSQLLSELAEDDYVVHEMYGIGIFKRVGFIRK